MKSSVVFGILAGLVIAISGHWASADETDVTCTRTRSCAVIAKRPVQGEGRSGAVPKGQRKIRDGEGDRRVSEARKKFHTAHTAYIRRLASYNRCLVTFNPSTDPGGCGNRPTAPTPPAFRTNTFSGPGNQPITAGQAAAIAVARLQLPTIAPGIGPSPNVNQWNMAAVGYPLWLWADGPTHVRVRSKHENCHGESRHLRQDLV